MSSRDEAAGARRERVPAVACEHSTSAWYDDVLVDDGDSRGDAGVRCAALHAAPDPRTRGRLRRGLAPRRVDAVTAVSRLGTAAPATPPSGKEHRS